jgi:hypothetical protein
MIQRPWTLVGSFFVLASLGIIGCSSADTQEDDDDTDTGGSSTGGAASGGTSSGGTSSGGTTATGGTSGGNTDDCKGISRDDPCESQGLECPDLVCGLADSGSRSCNCATTWMCSMCDYSNSWLQEMPTDIVACPDTAADEEPCTTNMQVCGPVGNEYCACYMDAQDGLIWDCDSPPTSWTM